MGVKATAFGSAGDLIIVESRIWGSRNYRDLALAVDTAATTTVVSSDIIEALGYHPRDGASITTHRSAIGKEQGYTLRVKQFQALGFVFENFEVDVFDLAAG